LLLVVVIISKKELTMTVGAAILVKEEVDVNITLYTIIFWQNSD